MTEADFEPFKAACDGDALRYRCTLREASKTREEVDRYCLEQGYASEVMALRLEDLINDWMDVAGRTQRKEPSPSTVDALYVDGDAWYLIEFKRNEDGKPLNQMKSKLLYKAYDSILQLVEHELRTVKQVRTYDTYIVVAFKVSGLTDAELQRRVRERGAEGCDLFEEAINGVCNDVLLRPWAASRPPVEANLDHWNTVLYRTALTLTPEQFNRFAKEHGWK